MKIKPTVLVSVVIPTYNGSKFIKRAVESILTQTYKNFELIIVDDGSVDNTKEVIASIKDSRIRYFYQCNKGPASAYNSGFKLATGEYIVIMDHDDESFPIRIEKQLQFMEMNSCDLVSSWYYIKHKRTGYLEEIKKNYNDADIKRILLFKPWVIHNPTVCVKRSVFEKHGFFNESYETSFDYEFYLRIKNHIVFGIVPEFLYNWSHSKTSYGSSNSIECRKTFRKIGQDRIEIEKQHMSKHQYYSNLGMLNYYSDNLIKSLFYLLRATSYKMKKQIVKYAIIIMLGGFCIKIFRRYNLFDMWLVRNLKNILLEI